MAQALAEKLEYIGPAEKERTALVLQSEQFARTPKPPLPKGKPQSHLSRSPGRDVGESR